MKKEEKVYQAKEKLNISTERYEKERVTTAYILRACRYHDELIEALKLTTVFVKSAIGRQDNSPWPQTLHERIKGIEKLLKEAEGK